MAQAQLVRPLSLFTPGCGGRTVYVYVGQSQTPADLFYDQAATQPAQNPQTLQTLAGTDYGCWAAPLYTTARSVTLRVVGLLETGVYDGPDQSLDGVDVSAALVGPFGGDAAFPLSDILALDIHVSKLGQLGADSADANTTLIQKGLAIAAGRGGGNVLLPPGTWPFTQLTLGPRQRLVGAGEGVTTLVSKVGDKAIIASGDDAGLIELTLDGAVAATGSIGLFLDLYRRFRLSGVTVRRFERGMRLRGGGYHFWDRFSLDANTYGAELWSDDKDRVSKGDTELFGVAWLGGGVTSHIQDAVHIKDQGEGARRFLLVNVAFGNNAGAALRVTGGQQVAGQGCRFSTNAKHLLVEDYKAVSPQLQARSIRFDSSLFDAGRTTWQDTARDLYFVACRFRAQTWEASSPTYPAILDRCNEVDRATYIGDATKVHRLGGPSDGRGSATTTDATVTVAWTQYLEPGQYGTLFATVAGRSVSTNDRASYVITASVGRDPAVLGYKAKVANFVNGAFLTGQNSGATATVVRHDTAASGTIDLVRVQGTFLDSEVITDDQGGQAQVNGLISLQDCFVADQDPTYTHENADASWDSVAGNTAQEITVTVKGAANKTVEWTVDARITLSF